MKTFTKNKKQNHRFIRRIGVIGCIAFLLFTGCKKADEPQPEPEPEPFVLTDLVGKALAVVYKNQWLVFYYFTEESGTVVANWRNHYDDGSFECTLNEEGKVDIDGDILTVAKDKQGNITATDVIEYFTDAPVVNFALYDAAEAPDFRTEGKLFKQNDNSYMKFSANKWGWSSTSTVTLDRDYTDSGDRPKLYFQGSPASGTHIGVMIPAGVQWGSYTGPLMLIHREGPSPMVFMQQ